MIRIIAQVVDPAKNEVIPPKIKPRQRPPQSGGPIPEGMTSSENIPLADDDPEELAPGGEAAGFPAGQPQAPAGAAPGAATPFPEEYEEILPPEQAEQMPPPEAPEEAEPSPFPEDEFEEITEKENELDRMNATMPIGQKIDMAMSEGYPLRIIYTTLKGHSTERTIRPDYYRPAKTTGNWVLIAWCELRQDWRGFIVNRIRAAKLEPKDQ